MTSVPEGWFPLTTLPPEGEPVEGLLSDGTTTAAEYWAGPDERPDWGGWGWDMTLRFASGDWTPDLDLVAWRRNHQSTESVA